MNGTGWTELLSAWLVWLHAAHLSPETIRTYTRIARRLSTLAATPDLITAEILAGFVSAAAKPNSAATRRIVARQLFRFAAQTHRVPSDPAFGLPRVKRPIGVPRPASDFDIASADRTDPRVDLMLQLGSRMGLRCMEIAAVHSGHLERGTSGWLLRVLGKGTKTRLVPCPDDLAARITAAGGFLFPSRRGDHLAPRTVTRMLSAALPGNLTGHTLRHRYGTRAYQLGGRDIRAVQQLLGHASVSTTQIYTGVEDEALWKAALAA